MGKRKAQNKPISLRKGRSTPIKLIIAVISLMISITRLICSWLLGVVLFFLPLDFPISSHPFLGQLKFNMGKSITQYCFNLLEFKKQDIILLPKP